MSIIQSDGTATVSIGSQTTPNYRGTSKQVTRGRDRVIGSLSVIRLVIMIRVK